VNRAPVDGPQLELPDGFVLGTATAAAQIEGAVRAGGRSASIWDEFSAQPGRILDGSDTSVTADHYHRYREDVELMRRLGLDAYRFSLSWTRLQPSGTGPLNPEGVDFYERLIEELLAAGITPFVTLSHWDLPVEYEAGWLERDTAVRFGEFAGLVAERFADRVPAWITINEPATVTLNGYALGQHAPGQAMLFDALPTVHHHLLGHGLAVQALRGAGAKGEIGITNVYSPVVAATQQPEDQVMAALFDLVHNTVFCEPVLRGRYPQPPPQLSELPPELAGMLDVFDDAPDEDLAAIAEPLDFYGLNYYMPSVVAAGHGDGTTPDGVSEAMAQVPFELVDLPGCPRTGFGWPVAPEYFATALQQMQQRYGDVLPPVYITENGASYPDDVRDWRVHDVDRIDYIAGHLQAALDATGQDGQARGMDLRGFFIWSLLDNWEWAAGFTQRFGLVHVDFETGRRTPKDSYYWLQQELGRRRVR